MKIIITWIKNNYPNVNYTWIVDKAINAIHYGFNLTKLPQNVADKIDYLGFRLVDLNFPLSWFELETIETQVPPFYNFTRIHIPKANLVFSFEDLYPYGYSIQHINATYILIGGVNGKENLYLDPITYSGGVTTFSGDVTAWDLWNASNVNGWGVAQKLDSSENTQYVFGCRVQGTWGTYSNWTDIDVQIFFNSTSVTGTYQSHIYLGNNNHATFGQLDDDNEKRTSHGVSLFSNSTYEGTYIIRGASGGSRIHLYSVDINFINQGSPSNVFMLGGGTFTASHIYNCRFQNVFITKGGWTLYNVDIYLA